MSEIISIDVFEPDYMQSCIVCGQSPVVTGIKGGKIVYNSEMCGPCTWGESEALDPSTWNDGSTV